MTQVKESGLSSFEQRLGFDFKSMTKAKDNPGFFARRDWGIGLRIWALKKESLKMILDQTHR